MHKSSRNTDMVDQRTLIEMIRCMLGWDAPIAIQTRRTLKPSHIVRSCTVEFPSFARMNAADEFGKLSPRSILEGFSLYSFCRVSYWI